jgi:hypothetical protein
MFCGNFQEYCLEYFLSGDNSAPGPKFPVKGGFIPRFRPLSRRRRSVLFRKIERL